MDRRSSSEKWQYRAVKESVGRTRPSKAIKLVVSFVQSLFFNEQVNVHYVLDTLLFDPLFWFIDHYLKHLGPLFVIIVFVMLLVFVLIAYAIGIPFWYDRSPTVLAIAFPLGHWLLLNVSWNYYKALTTSPGYPSEKPIVKEFVGFCKKCIGPKPLRAHHCSVCNRCILKMDHHCPWLNKCIGHFNHRYFFLFCLYTWIGTIFVMAFGVFIAVEHYFPTFSIFDDLFYYDSSLKEYDYTFTILGLFEMSSARIRHRCIVTEAIIAILLFFLLGLLLRYHIILITNGETCIERHENRAKRIRFRAHNRAYQNPYDFGARANWRTFLGFDRNAHPWRHILLPSSFTPIGDGFSWRTIYDSPVHIEVDRHVN